MGRPKGSNRYDHDRIVQLHRSGVPSAAIARRLGCSRKTVNNVIRRHLANEGKAAS